MTDTIKAVIAAVVVAAILAGGGYVWFTRKALAAELEATPLFKRMIYAASARCNCGAGLAYDPASKGDADSPFKGPSKWECGDILRYKTLTLDEQAVVQSKTHDRGFPFAFYEIKSENQPSANGQTTRPLINGGIAQSEAFTKPAPHSDMQVGSGPTP